MFVPHTLYRSDISHFHTAGDQKTTYSCRTHSKTHLKKKKPTYRKSHSITGKCKISPRRWNLLLTVTWIRYISRIWHGWGGEGWVEMGHTTSAFGTVSLHRQEKLPILHTKPQHSPMGTQRSRSMWLPIKECNSQTRWGYEIKRT
jgi:hypothetical protein